MPFQKGNIYRFSKEHKAWNKGLKGVQEAWNKGKVHSKKTIKKMREIKLGKNNPMYGVNRSGKNNPNYKNGISYRKNNCENCGKEISYKATYCSRCFGLGVRSSQWKGGIAPLSVRIRNLAECHQWRTAIFQRDDYTCQKCGLHSGCGKAVRLEAHHIKEFTILLAEFLQEYNQFSPYEDIDTLVRLAIKWQPFWDAEGETLCEDCHKLTDNYKNKKGGEKICVKN